MWGRAGTFAANQDDFDHTFRVTLMGRRANEVLHGGDGPGPHLARKISGEENFRNLQQTNSSTRQPGVDPVSAAFVAAGATGVPRHESRTMNENGDLESPSVDWHVEV